jgi:hypothetical protein
LARVVGDADQIGWDAPPLFTTSAPPVDSKMSPTMRRARCSENSFCTIARESPRQYSTSTNGYFFSNASTRGRSAWFSIMPE